MSDTYQSLSHSRWDCKYHVVFVPKRGDGRLVWHIRKALGAIFHALARQKECRILEGHLMPEHVHIVSRFPPRHAVASVIGFLKGKSAIAIARQLAGRERISRANTSGRGGMRSRPLGSHWSKSAPISATKREDPDEGDVLVPRRQV